MLAATIFSISLHATQVSAAADRPTRRSASCPPCCTQNDVDGECDKLVTDDGQQLTTLTVNLS